MAACCPGGTLAAMMSGPLTPGPNPVANASKACRVVRLVGSFPASVKASLIEKNGTARQSSTSSAAVPATSG